MTHRQAGQDNKHTCPRCKNDWLYFEGVKSVCLNCGYTVGNGRSKIEIPIEEIIEDAWQLFHSNKIRVSSKINRADAPKA